MKKIVAIGGSNSKKSMNKTLARYAANQIENSEIIVADLNDFDLPIYGIDLETENGIPEDATKLDNLLESADALVISLAEHNGSYTTAFKNAFDWLSRIDQKVWKNKPMLLMSTSPGGRGGLGVLQGAKMTFPHLGGNIIADFSLPSFYDNFSEEGLKNEKLNTDLNQKIKLLQKAI
ncbi:NAD(P)H-dependent FMN reductase [Aquimarina sp. EL_43]|uniref:NADPH-dependent FMN reductase n=1 Tax=Aquimarina TaxID=290174 RepID=UPI000471E10A|nr:MULTISPECIES: NAD(P)H-dependent oxidoreductase [Aquimarina]MBG6129448.1 NAD(P)H-dependent FMN reductase [Aquimarina sp. EL_35]MBG6150513.1 NAD(P)H-dependent FMN reductase [Aquimarina sp. EL_32]MBG6168179.1 NAD(P)H-dependent FMN reductase [Aquimarina sp. EL_43]